MTAKKAAAGSARRSGPREWLTPARIAVIVLTALAIVFIFENTDQVEIRILVPLVTMPLYLALLAMFVIGALCGGLFFRRRER
ncbi:MULTISPECIES: lipopolysaccharide assembly protein LapA domain-containing protein [unclassified Streptomyces]|uniref:lipopolysaccharide assembly protein LapA domain-containing protein n=1 Tax=unclassified Streptomyces TaxID=2593676 RepID=UPI003652053C